MATTQATPIGTVSIIQGEVLAQGHDGSARRLHMGDPVHEGELITTAAGGSIEVTMSNGRMLPIDEQQAVALDSEVSGAVLEDTSLATLTMLSSGETLSVIQALTPEAANLLLAQQAAAADASIGADGSVFVDLIAATESTASGSYDSGFRVGADTFAWRFGEDDGVAAAPIDHITDWGTGGLDVVNLKDLIQLDDPATLTNYLHFSFDGAHTTLEVKVGGSGFTSDSLTARAGGGDQVIVFDNVDLTSGASNQADVINALLGANKLIID